jgi:DNA-binding response OmpR family regulator
MDQKRILVVEDEASLRNVLSDKLTSEGFLVDCAVDGAEGLRLAREKHPDLILLDLIMPIMDGLTMLEELRKDDTYGKNALVILLTNVNDRDKVAKATEVGTYDYLVKSDWDLNDVVKMVRTRLAMHS